ncbi:MAG: hypothetical protein ABIP64_07820 [Burkholderiales bacterium]
MTRQYGLQGARFNVPQLDYSVVRTGKHLSVTAERSARYRGACFSAKVAFSAGCDIL